jgi:hypothetical protein
MDELSAGSYNYSRVPAERSDPPFMSPRDRYWFLAGAASGLTIGALGIYFAMSSSISPTNTAGGDRAAADTETNGQSTPRRPDLVMPGDRWPTTADVESTDASGNARKEAASNAGSLEDVTQKLAQRLATKGGTDEEWRLLAQSYEYMGRTNEAQAARAHIMTGEANASAVKLTAANPTPVTPTQSRASETAPGSRISGTVRIDPSLAGSATAGTTLFVYATDATSSGPPLAVLRLQVDRWPVSFVLDDADAMIPGRNLSSSQHIQLEARISPSGDALPRPGDLVGKIQNVDPRTQQPLNISIDQKIR